jgi:DNA-binding MarR family transcriptional regulator
MNVLHSGRLLGMLWFRYNRRLSANLRKAQIDITADQWLLLMQLSENEWCNQRFLSKQLGRDRSAITRMVQMLEKRGWLKRSDDPDDKRAFRVSLTPSGRKVYEQGNEISQQTLDMLWAGFRNEEKDLCSDYLFRLTQNMR